jgi:hypothetical protein
MVNRSDVFGTVVVLLIIVLIVKMYMNSETANLKCIFAGKDGNKYCVRERTDTPAAAKLLAEVHKRLERLVKHLEKTHPNRDHCKRIIERFESIKIIETLPTSEHTAYSENKGEKIALCLNKKQKETEPHLIDINTLTFVAVHELAHVGTQSEGHEPEFWNNFKFLLDQATQIGLYEPIDYKKSPQAYCGDKLTDNPLFDL